MAKETSTWFERLMSGVAALFGSFFNKGMAEENRPRRRSNQDVERGDWVDVNDADETDLQDQGHHERFSPNGNPNPAIYPSLRPVCPACFRPMALRTAKRGGFANKRFWGCRGYPACTGTRVVEF